MPLQVVLITGSSKGIGQEIALLLARDPQRRFKVYATMRNQSTRQDDLKTKAGSSLDDTLFIRELDVTKQETIDKTVKEIVDSEGRIDVLALPVMVQYNASKSALEGFSESIAPPLRKFNVWVSIIHLGSVITDMSLQFGSGPTPILRALTKEIPEDTRNIVEQMVTTNPDDVIGTKSQTANDIAKLVEDVILSDKPNFRYQSSQTIQRMARQRFLDPTGNEMMDTWLKQ
ncbi:retinol dehydrogenase 8-like [Amphiura filiformis]|uniref:retinol dehydrogenase 8-like n=1 Tax=Amphiura filiformis TaxID=82378 RepID=UPI003B221190